MYYDVRLPYRRPDVIQALISGRASLNTRDRHGQTPLFFAANAATCDQLVGAKERCKLKSTIIVDGVYIVYEHN